MRFWQELKRGQPGRRFQSRYERARREHPGALRKWSLVALGVALVAAGVVLLPLPGPGMVIVAAGLALMAERSRATARALDWLELRVRRFAGLDSGTGT